MKEQSNNLRKSIGLEQSSVIEISNVAAGSNTELSPTPGITAFISARGIPQRSLSFSHMESAGLLGSRRSSTVEKEAIRGIASENGAPLFVEVLSSENVQQSEERSMYEPLLLNLRNEHYESGGVIPDISMIEVLDIIISEAQIFEVSEIQAELVTGPTNLLLADSATSTFWNIALVGIGNFPKPPPNFLGSKYSVFTFLVDAETGQIAGRGVRRARAETSSR